MNKSETRLIQLFALFSISIFAYLIFDLCLSYIYVYDLALGQSKSVPVISLIPLIKV